MIYSHCFQALQLPIVQLGLAEDTQPADEAIEAMYGIRNNSSSPWGFFFTCSESVALRSQS